MSMQSLIEEILRLKRFAVSGASSNPEKVSNRLYRTLKDAGYIVYAVNPNAVRVDGDPSYPSLDTLPEPVDCLVTVTQPEVTEETIYLASRLHIPYVWMQPGSDSLSAENSARASGIQSVSGGPCLLMTLQSHYPSLTLR